MPLDRNGHVIPTRESPPASALGLRFWQAPSAITPNIHEPPYHGPRHPLPGACELSQHGLPGLTPEWGHVISRIRPVSDSQGEVFLPCIDTEYYLHGWPLEVSVLVDAAQPAVNCLPLVGYSALRVAAMGMAERSPRPAEVDRMRAPQPNGERL